MLQLDEQAQPTMPGQARELCTGPRVRRDRRRARETTLEQGLCVAVELSDTIWDRFASALTELTPEEAEWRPVPQANSINFILRHLRIEAEWHLATLERGTAMPDDVPPRVSVGSARDAGGEAPDAGDTARGGLVRPESLGVMIAVALSTSCVDHPGGDRQPIHEQRLPSGKVVKVVSCLLAWGVEHDERFPDRDAFALEYLSSVPRIPPQELEREVLEVFELVRPISEQWGLSTASVAALRSPERTGTYDVFAFSRSPAGKWTYVRQAITRNEE